MNKLLTTDNILNGKPCDVLYTGYLNKDISFGDIVYFEPYSIQYKKLVNGVIDQLKVLLIDGDGNEIWSNFKGAPSHNKQGCAILTKKVALKNPGTYLKLRPKNPGTYLRLRPKILGT